MKALLARGFDTPGGADFIIQLYERLMDAYSNAWSIKALSGNEWAYLADVVIEQFPYVRPDFDFSGMFTAIALQQPFLPDSKVRWEFDYLHLRRVLLNMGLAEAVCVWDTICLIREEAQQRILTGQRHRLGGEQPPAGKVAKVSLKKAVRRVTGQIC